MGVHCLGTRACATYLLRTPSATTVVDTGGPLDPREILREARRMGVTRIDNILVTHAHLDHVWGLRALARQTGARVIVHRGDARALEAGKSKVGVQLVTDRRAQRALIWLAERLPTPGVRPDVVVRDGQSLERYLGVASRAVHVPGHTPGSCAFVVDFALHRGAPEGREQGEMPGGRAVFVGDMVANTRRPTWQRAFATEPWLMRRSIARLRDQLTEGSVVYPGHGAPLTGASLRALPIPPYRALSAPR